MTDCIIRNDYLLITRQPRDLSDYGYLSDYSLVTDVTELMRTMASNGKLIADSANMDAFLTLPLNIATLADGLIACVLTY